MAVWTVVLVLLMLALLKSPVEALNGTLLGDVLSNPCTATNPDGVTPVCALNMCLHLCPTGRTVVSHCVDGRLQPDPVDQCHCPLSSKIENGQLDCSCLDCRRGCAVGRSVKCTDGYQLASFVSGDELLTCEDGKWKFGYGLDNLCVRPLNCEIPASWRDGHTKLTSNDMEIDPLLLESVPDLSRFQVDCHGDDYEVLLVLKHSELVCVSGRWKTMGFVDIKPDDLEQLCLPGACRKSDRRFCYDGEPPEQEVAHLECYHESERCNGQQDCTNGADEKSCDNHSTNNIYISNNLPFWAILLGFVSILILSLIIFSVIRRLRFRFERRARDRRAMARRRRRTTSREASNQPDGAVFTVPVEPEPVVRYNTTLLGVSLPPSYSATALPSPGGAAGLSDDVGLRVDLPPPTYVNSNPPSYEEALRLKSTDSRLDDATNAGPSSRLQGSGVPIGKAPRTTTPAIANEHSRQSTNNVSATPTTDSPPAAGRSQPSDASHQPLTTSASTPANFDNTAARGRSGQGRSAVRRQRRAGRGRPDDDYINCHQV